MSSRTKSRKSRSRSRSIGTREDLVVTPVVETPVVVTRGVGDMPPHKAAAVGVGVVYGIFLVVLLVFSIIFLTQLHKYTVNGQKVLNTNDGKVLYGALITGITLSLIAILVATVTGRGIGLLLVLIAFVANVLVLVYLKKLFDMGARDGDKTMKDNFAAKFVFWGIVANFILAGLLLILGIVHDKKENML